MLVYAVESAMLLLTNAFEMVSWETFEWCSGEIWEILFLPTCEDLATSMLCFSGRGAASSSRSQTPPALSWLRKCPSGCITNRETIHREHWRAIQNGCRPLGWTLHLSLKIYGHRFSIFPPTLILNNALTQKTFLWQDFKVTRKDF